jgi:DNA-binding winged helix-turn-helix (wHTH) protein
MPRYLFDQFCLDTDTRELSRGGAPLRLTPRAFRLLEILLRASPKAVSKRDLLDQVWEGTIVEEANLKTLVLEIRSAIAERGGERDVIRTVYAFGYAFARAVSDGSGAQAPVAVMRLNGQAPRMLAPGTYLIGRRSDCAIVIDSPSVSRVHVKLDVTPHRVAIEDLRSKNGTFVDGRRVEGSVELPRVATVRIGEVDVELTRIDTARDSTQTVT